MRCALMVLFLLPCLWVSPVHAEEQTAVSVAVMEFTSKGGVTQEQMDALSDMVANRIRGLGNYQVIGKSDIRAALHLEQQKQMLGCDNESCMAEIGGALGVRWMVVGNVSLFGKTYLLNLKLIDVEKVKVAQGLSKTIKGGEDALVEALPSAVDELMAAAHTDLTGEKAPAPEPKKIPPPVKAAPENVEWFSLPDEEGPFVRGLVGGLTGFKGEGVTEYDVTDVGLNDAADDLAATRNGALFGVEAGYSFYRWLRAYGGVGGYVTAATEDGVTRRRDALELAVGLESGIPLNSWAEPLIYTAFGISMMESSNAGEGADLKGTAFLFDLGLGLNFYLNPHWFVGLKAGVALRMHRGMEYEICVLDNCRMESDEEFVGNLVGGFVGLSSGYQF